MATYKKRGYKPKTKAEREQIEELESTTAEVFNTLDESASKTEAWVAKNQRYILIGIGVIALAVLGYLGYKEFVQKPTETEATNEMFQAQHYFEQALTASNPDSLFTLALEGGEGKYGFLDIIDKYSGTKAANLANYAAGMSYLNMKSYEEAIKHLNDFSSDDPVIGANAKGGIGDAFAQLDQNGEAMEYYEKAISHSTNDFTTPLYLMKAGVLALSTGDKEKALQLFNRIKDEFPNTDQGRNVDVFIGKALSMQ